MILWVHIILYRYGVEHIKDHIIWSMDSYGFWDRNSFLVSGGPPSRRSLLMTSFEILELNRYCIAWGTVFSILYVMLFNHLTCDGSNWWLVAYIMSLLFRLYFYNSSSSILFSLGCKNKWVYKNWYKKTKELIMIECNHTKLKW